MARAIDADALKKELAPYEENDFSQQIEVILKIVDMQPTLTPPNEWVSVEEKLPENNTEVLMWSARWKIAEAGSYYNQHFWVYSEIGDGYIADNITYWMYLPAPPGKGNNVPTNEPEYREYTCPNCHHTWLEDRDASDYPEYCPGCGDPLHKEENEPLTLEQLREMDETPIYVVTEAYGSGWCILNWHGVNKSYTYFSRTGTSEGMTATPLSAKTYGDLWTAYRRPPGGEEGDADRG